MGKEQQQQRQREEEENDIEHLDELQQSYENGFLTYFNSKYCTRNIFNVVALGLSFCIFFTAFNTTQVCSLFFKSYMMREYSVTYIVYCNMIELYYRIKEESGILDISCTLFLLCYI
jgi:hypothetical protein